MSHPRANDGEYVFDFDAFEGPGPSALALPSTEREDLSDMPDGTQFPSLDFTSFSAASTPAEGVNYIDAMRLLDSTQYEGEEEAELFKGKGKAVSRPMDILPRGSNDAAHFDLFSFTSSGSSSARNRWLSSAPSSSVSTPQTLASFMFSTGVTPNSMDDRGSFPASYQTDITTPGSYYGDDGEGKAGKDVDTGMRAKTQEEVPVLPPLSFTASEFTRGETNWPIESHEEPSPNHSSYFSTLTSTAPIQFPSVTSSADQPSDNETRIQSYRDGLQSRSRSFSSLSTQSTKSFAARSMTKLKLGLGGKGARSGLARKILLRKCDDLPRAVLDLEQAEKYACGVSGQRYPSFIRFSDSEIVHTVSEPSTPFSSPAEDSASAELARRVSYPSPTTLVSLSSEDVHVTEDRADLFDEMLPREIKIFILKVLLAVHETEGQQLVQSATWTASEAGKNERRWIGRNAGILELVRLSRVSKAWQQLVFDGELWANLDLQAFPSVPTHLLLRLATSSGSFVQSFNFSGHTRLSSASLLAITKSFCITISQVDDRPPITQLTLIDLTGCSAITTHSLHDLLAHSPLLLDVRLKGLMAVSNATCEVLAASCRSLLSLDVSRCHNMDANGLLSLVTHAHGRPHALKELRVSSLKRVNDTTLEQLGKYLPSLEVLDLSGVRELHNSALDAFVSSPEDEDDRETISVSSRELGRDPGDPTKYRRRVTRLRHLSLSSCPLLSDVACSNLAHAMPKLEFLELASIGSELRDDGLVRLLRTTPLLRRLDLEEACDISDATVEAITPRMEDSAPGSSLESLNLSYAVNVSNQALLDLIRACSKLRELELDNTRVSGAVVKEFVHLSRKRRTLAAEVVAVDCRGVGESTVKELADATRTRKGWRSWDARNLRYLDARDDEALGVGHDECDDKKVVLKTFYSWQTVDAVDAAREKRRKDNEKADSGGKEDVRSKRSSPKWWTPGARRASGSTSPLLSGSYDREGCIIM